MVYQFPFNAYQCHVVETEKPLSSGLKVVEKCSLAKDLEDPEITMDFIVMQKALAMTQEMGSREWLGYVKGFPTEKGFHIDEILIPKQTATYSDVEDIERVTDEDIIGTIHSHHTMGTFFSGTDHDYIGANNPVMIVIDSKGNTKAAVRAKLQCGNYILLEAELTILYADNPEIKDFVTVSKSKIAEKVYVQANPCYQYGNNLHPYFYGQNQNQQCNQHPNIINARIRRWDKDLRCWVYEPVAQPDAEGGVLSSATAQGEPILINTDLDESGFPYWPGW